MTLGNELSDSSLWSGLGFIFGFVTGYLYNKAQKAVSKVHHREH